MPCKGIGLLLGTARNIYHYYLVMFCTKKSKLRLFLYHYFTTVISLSSLFLGLYSFLSLFSSFMTKLQATMRLACGFDCPK